MDKVSIRRHVTKGEDGAERYIYTRAWFKCPGCGHYHGYTIELGSGEQGPVWTFNGNLESPTFSPSLRTWYNLADPNIPHYQCHFFVTDGVIRFCGDCVSDGKPAPWNGKIIPLPDLDPDSWLSKAE